MWCSVQFLLFAPLRMELHCFVAWEKQKKGENVFSSLFFIIILKEDRSKTFFSPSLFHSYLFPKDRKNCFWVEWVIKRVLLSFGAFSNYDRHTHMYRDRWERKAIKHFLPNLFKPVSSSSFLLLFLFSSREGPKIWHFFSILNNQFSAFESYLKQNYHFCFL